MTSKETVTVLTEMNKWRRGEPPYGNDKPHLAPYDGETFGRAIDSAVELLQRPLTTL